MPSRAIFLRVEQRGAGTRLHKIVSDVMVIGRSVEADLRIPYAAVSRRHAQLTRAGDHFFLEDLESHNGTYVNRRRIRREVELKPGDVVRIGDTTLQLQAPGAAEPPVRRVELAIVSALAGFILGSALFLLVLSRTGGDRGSDGVRMAVATASSVKAGQDKTGTGRAE